jgi:signal transduction histidine kinase
MAKEIQTSSLRVKVGIAFGAALICLAVLWILQYRATRRLVDDDKWVSHTQEVLGALATVRNRLSAADASIQSFVITGERGYVTDYSQAILAIHGQLERLRRLTADNARQQKRLDDLVPQVDSATRAFQNEIEARKSGTPTPTADKLLPLEHAVRKANDAIRTTLGEMDEEERDLLFRRTDMARRANQQTNSLLLLGGLVALVFLTAAGVTLYFEIAKRGKAEERRIKAQEALLRTNKELENEVVERRQAEISLQNSARSLRELSLHLLQAQDEERRRVGRELHDSVGQSLSVLKMGLDAVTAMPDHTEKAAFEKKLAECTDLAEESIKEVRTVSYLLHPPMLEELGLQSAITWYLEGFSKRSGIQTKMDSSPDFGRLPPGVELALFRVLQESLTNVHRHSGSPTAYVRLLSKDGLATIEVEDYGKGLPSGVSGDSRASPPAQLGVGLRSMHERMQQLGGKLEMYSSKKGTVLRATVPIQQSSSAKTTSA